MLKIESFVFIEFQASALGILNPRCSRRQLSRSARSFSLSLSLSPLSVGVRADSETIARRALVTRRYPPHINNRAPAVPSGSRLLMFSRSQRIYRCAAATSCTYTRRGPPSLRMFAHEDPASAI